MKTDEVCYGLAGIGLIVVVIWAAVGFSYSNIPIMLGILAVAAVLGIVGRFSQKRREAAEELARRRARAAGGFGSTGDNAGRMG